MSTANQLEICNSTVTYFDTTDFLSTTLHSMSFFQYPSHIFGAIVIIFHTPHGMASVKWSLLSLHVWSSILDVYWSLLAIPFVTFPYMAGNGIGVLSELGLDTRFQVYLSVTIVAVLVATMVKVYENRWFLLARNLKKWKKIRKKLCLIHYFASCTYFIPLLFFVPYQEEAVPYVLKVSFFSN
nr:protein F37B4.1 [imported] - Caenorhabditis elegans [Caenorhabditis elegans]